MPKKQLLIGSILLVFIFTAAAAHNAHQSKGPAQLVIPGGSKGDIPLPHQLHQTKLDGCGHCHDLFDHKAGEIERLKQTGKLKKMQVMHQCQACHRDLRRADKPAGPLRCNECHQP